MTKIHIYIVLIISLIVVACESDSDIVLRPASQSAVMTSFIYVDSVATVNVYGAVSVSDTQRIATLGDVEVKLTCGDISRLHYLEEGETRALFADMTLREGDTVEVRSSYADKALVARTYIPTTPHINSVDTLYNSLYGLLYLYIDFTDLVSTTDYYQLVVRRKYTNQEGKAVEEEMKCNYYDYLFYQATVGLSNVMTGLFTDETINGKSYTLKLSVPYDDIWRNVPEGDSVAIEVDLHHHTEEYYNYARSAAAVDSYLLLPVFINTIIYSNVSGGFGIVSGMAHCKETIILNR